MTFKATERELFRWIIIISEICEDTFQRIDSLALIPFFSFFFFLSFFLLAFGEKKRKKEGPTIKRSRFDSFFIEDTTSSVNLTRDCSLVSCSPDEQAVGRCFFFAFNPRVASVKQLTIFKQTFCVESGRVSNTAEDGADKCLGINLLPS